MNILSIDFDYFQKVSKETLAYYPDGHDFGSELATIIWAGHYINPSERQKIMSVTTDKDKLQVVMTALKKQNIYADVLIAQSHKHIAQFIKDNVPTSEPLHIVNLDMHHDTFEHDGKSEADFSRVDCGNWGSVILNNYSKADITWVNQDASDVYGKGDDRLIVTQDLNKAIDKDFGMIFICRSDIWLPPHLDPDFKKLFNCASRHFYNVKYEKDIDKPRSMKEIEERVEAEISFYKKNYPEYYKKEFGEEPASKPEKPKRTPSKPDLEEPEI